MSDSCHWIPIRVAEWWSRMFHSLRIKNDVLNFNEFYFICFQYFWRILSDFNRKKFSLNNKETKNKENIAQLSHHEEHCRVFHTSRTSNRERERTLGAR